MVHYIRFLRTPQVAAGKKTIDISAVVAVETDLGDALYAEDIDLVVEVLEARHPRGVLCTTNLGWQSTSRALKFTIQCPGKYVSRSACLHVTTRVTQDSLKSLNVPQILDVWSLDFPLSDKQRTEPIVERQIWLGNGSCVRMREETGNSIARHIWDASLGFIMYLDRALQASPPTAGVKAISKLMKSSKVRKMKVLELGAGCGVVGVAFAQIIKCDMLLTDLEDAQDILESNVGLASPVAGSSIRAQQLDWATGLDDSSNAKFDLILVSDCIYNPDSSVHLVETLKQLATGTPDVLILVGFKRRHEADTIFFERMQQSHFAIVESINIPLPHAVTEYDAEPPVAEFFTYTLSSKVS